MAAVPASSITPEEALDKLLHHLNSGPSGYPFYAFQVLAQSADIAGLLRASSLPGVVRNHLANMMNAAACCDDPSTPDAVYLRRLEHFVWESDANAAAFRASVDSDLLEGFFYDLEERSFTDFGHFDSVVARVVSLLGQTYTGADAVAGLAPADYWSRVVAMAEPKYDDSNLPMWLSDVKPAFWAACVERALDSGMTADSLVHKQGEWPALVRDAERETFRDCIAARAGAGCAVMFDAIVARRLMAARIASLGDTPQPTPCTRRARASL